MTHIFTYTPVGKRTTLVLVNGVLVGKIIQVPVRGHHLHPHYAFKQEGKPMGRIYGSLEAVKNSLESIHKGLFS